MTPKECVFGLAAARIDFDRIEFERIDFGQKWVWCELIYVLIHLYKSNYFKLMLFGYFKLKLILDV